MTDDPNDLTRRYLVLWTQYMTALLANPRAMETLNRWSSLTGQFAYPQPGSAKGEGTGTALPPWPPFFGPFGLGPVPPAAAAPSQENGAAELARRVDELERRLAVLERRLEARRRSRRARTGGG